MKLKLPVGGRVLMSESFVQPIRSKQCIYSETMNVFMNESHVIFNEVIKHSCVLL